MKTMTRLGCALVAATLIFQPSAEAQSTGSSMSSSSMPSSSSSDSSSSDSSSSSSSFQDPLLIALTQLLFGIGPSPSSLGFYDSADINKFFFEWASGKKAGGSWYNPKEPLIEDKAPIQIPYFQYSFTDLEDQVGNFDGTEHSLKAGYALLYDSGTLLNFSYQYGNRDIDQPANPGDIDIHAISGTVGQRIFETAFLSFTGGYVTGGLPPQFGNVDNRTWYMNPSIGKTWNLGDLTFLADLSYWHADEKRPGANGGQISDNWDQISVGLNSRYNLSDALSISVGLAYYDVVDHNFGAIFDENWWNFDANLGYTCSNGLETWIGYSQAFDHDQVETKSFRIGAGLPF